MEWPPQNTGLFAPAECIMCKLDPCVASYLDEPFNPANWTLTKDTSENAGITTTYTNMGTFGRMAFNLPAEAFGLARQYIFTGAEYDPQNPECGEGAPSIIGITMRARIFSETVNPSETLSFFPIVTQNGKFYYAGFSVRHWNYNTVTGIFATKGVSCNWNDGDAWSEFSPSGGGPSGPPDFTDTGAPIKLGFRVIGSNNFMNALPGTVTFDIEFVSGGAI